jgi:hypothetical protein
MRYAREGLFALALLSAGAVGCSRNHASETPAPVRTAGSESVRLTVDNESFSDMDVLVVADSGLRSSLGAVPAGTEAEYKLSSNEWAEGMVRLEAVRVGGERVVAHAGPLPLFSGNAIDFTIEPNLRESYAMVRYGAR